MKNPRKFHVLEGRVLLLLCVVFISWQAVSHGSSGLPEAISDKLLHFMAFYVLSLLADFSFPKTTFNAVKITVLLGYGVLIEVVQSFFPHRSSSMADIAADLAGIMVYMISVPLLKRLPIIRERWSA